MACWLRARTCQCCSHACRTLGAKRAVRPCTPPWHRGRAMTALPCRPRAPPPPSLQDHVKQYFEDVLPFEDFSLRLNNEDLPYLREILRAVTEEEYRRLLENVLRYQKAFTWNTELGGQVRGWVGGLRSGLVRAVSCQCRS